MINKKVKHLKFGIGTIVEVIDRSAPIVKINNETGEISTVASNLPDLVKVEFETGEIKTFQEPGLENPKWFELESEVSENE